MSLNKAIDHNKENRKPYTGSKAIDTSCRNHGSCSWCKDNRTYQTKKEAIGMEIREKEYWEWNKEYEKECEVEFY